MAQPHGSTHTVGIVAFDDMEVLDYAGPYEVFNVAGELIANSAIQVRSIGVKAGPITGRGGFTVLPSATIHDAILPTILVIPGGLGTRSLLHDQEVISWIRKASAQASLVLSVCSGALVLGAAGLLADRSATTHHGAFGELTAISPSTKIVRGQRFVQSSESLWTSAGVSAGIDLSLHLVSLLLGSKGRDMVIEEMEWGW